MYALTQKDAQMFDESMIEQETFMKVLYHDAKMRGGFFGRFQFGDEFIPPVWNANPVYLEVDPLEMQEDVYVSVHSYRKKSRKGENAFTLNAFFFDLDIHDKEKQGQLPTYINNTLDLLKNSADGGVLPRPTMITHTGRGLGLFYVLERSIAVIESTEKQVAFWRSLYGNLADKISNTLQDSDKNVLELDYKVVKDCARVCRLPGTYNSHTGTMCKIQDVFTVDGEPFYYSMKQLAKYINRKKPNKKKTKANKPSNLIDFNAARVNPMLFNRMRKLQRAQEVLRDKVGTRNSLCIIYYSTIAGLYDTDTSVNMLNEFNAAFDEPIPEKELLNIIKHCQEKEAGRYYFKESTIIKWLDLKSKLAHGEITQEEYDYVGFGKSSRAIAQAEQTARNKEKRAQRNAQIVDYVVEHPEETYEEIAKAFSLSEKTIRRILKAANITRYNRKQQTFDNTGEAIVTVKKLADILAEQKRTFLNRNTFVVSSSDGMNEVVLRPCSTGEVADIVDISESVGSQLTLRLDLEFLDSS